MDPLQDRQETIPTTAQVVLLHPTFSNTVYWVLNKEEEQRVYGISSEQISPKPAGWGNPGGGVEYDIDGINEHGHLRLREETVRACAKREVEDETGFLNFHFIPYYPSRVPFIVRSYQDHCVIVFVARLHDFIRCMPVKEQETGEIIRGMWFNLAISPVDTFEPKAILPYRSHIQRTIMCLDKAKHLPSQARHIIHPLWRFVFPVGKGDVRFPPNGYSLSSQAWACELRHHIQSYRRTVDLDHIYEKYRQEIDKARDAAQGQPSIVTKPAVDPTYVIPSDDPYANMQEAYQRKLLEEEQAWKEFGEDLARSRV